MCPPTFARTKRAKSLAKESQGYHLPISRTSGHETTGHEEIRVLTPWVAKSSAPLGRMVLDKNQPRGVAWSTFQCNLIPQASAAAATRTQATIASQKVAWTRPR